MSEKKDNKGAQAEVKGNPEVQLPDPEELVEYNAAIIPGIKKQKPIVVGVNGEIIRIKRGETVKIKRKFVEVLDNANKQTMSIYNTIEETKKQGEKPAAEM